MPTWTYIRDGEEHGPVPTHTLRQLARTGGLKPDDIVQPVGSTDGAAVPARNVMLLFPNAPAYNTADCPACGTPVTIRPPVRSMTDLKDEFVPWYKERFKRLIDLGSPVGTIAQVAVWYLGCGFIWIPLWFLLDTRPVVVKAAVRCEKCNREFDALSEGRKLRSEPFDWSRVQQAAGKVAFGLYAAWVAFAAVFVLGVGALTLVVGGALAVDARTCRHCGSERRPGYAVCPRCGRSQ